MLGCLRVGLHDFSFSLEAMLEMLKGILSGSYLFQGDIFRQHVYDYDFLIEVSEVDRSVGRSFWVNGDAF